MCIAVLRLLSLGMFPELFKLHSFATSDEEVMVPLPQVYNWFVAEQLIYLLIIP
jgi:hypothetical protein